MSVQYIWQLPAWRQGDAPAFVWQQETLLPLLEQVRLQQGRLLGKSEVLTQEQGAAQLDALVQNALRTSEIEGEKLNLASVRSSKRQPGYYGLVGMVFICRAGCHPSGIAAFSARTQHNPVLAGACADLAERAANQSA
jgi:hypothetical protein